MSRDLSERRKNPDEYPREVAGPFSGKEVSEGIAPEQKGDGGSRSH